LSLAVTPSLQDAWFSGFLEAEGCFYATFTTPSPRSLKPRLSQKFHITQQDIAGERILLEKFGVFLESTSQVRLVKKTNVYRLEVCSLKSHSILISYLEQFPLQGKKKIAYRRWWRVYLQRVEKKQFTEKGFQKMQRLCRSINKQSIQRVGEKTSSSWNTDPLFSRISSGENIDVLSDLVESENVNLFSQDARNNKNLQSGREK